jgi:hypothetical protein
MSIPEQLQILADRLTRISNARKLNASPRTKLYNRLSLIDSQIFALTYSAASPKYNQPSTHHLPEPEKAILIHHFWGNRDDSTDSPRRYTTPPKSLPSAISQRKFFLNSGRNARQRCLAASGGFQKVTIDRLNLFSADSRFILIDAVRFFVIGRVFRDSISIRMVYPWINATKMREFCGNLIENGEHKLEEDRIDVAEMQERITAVLKPQKQLEMSMEEGE